MIKKCLLSLTLLIQGDSNKRGADRCYMQIQHKATLNYIIKQYLKVVFFVNGSTYCIEMILFITPVDKWVVAIMLVVGGITNR